MFEKRYWTSTAALLLLLIFMIQCVGCTKGPVDANNTAATPMPLLDVATLPPSSSSEVGEHVVSKIVFAEAEPTENPSIGMLSYTAPETVKELFAVTSTVVFGEVKQVKEYKAVSTYHDGFVNTTYFSGIDFKVSKSYGGKKVLDGKTISISYGISQHRDCGEAHPMPKKGEKYFFFLLYSADHLTKEAQAEYVKTFPYILPCTKENIIEQVDGGYNVAYLDALINGDYDPESTLRMSVKGTKTHVEKVINQNIDNMRGITNVELGIEKNNKHK